MVVFTISFSALRDKTRHGICFRTYPPTPPPPKPPKQKNPYRLLFLSYRACWRSQDNRDASSGKWSFSLKHVASPPPFFGACSFFGKRIFFPSMIPFFFLFEPGDRKKTPHVLISSDPSPFPENPLLFPSGTLLREREVVPLLQGHPLSSAERVFPLDSFPNMKVFVVTDGNSFCSMGFFFVGFSFSGPSVQTPRFFFRYATLSGNIRFFARGSLSFWRHFGPRYVRMNDFSRVKLRSCPPSSATLPSPVKLCLGPTPFR